MSFRATFLRTNYKEEQENKVGKTDSATDYLPSRPITTDYDRLRPITTDYERLELEEKKILLYLLDNNKITRREAVKLLEFGETKTKEIINSLIDKKLIKREGKGRGTYYTLI